MARKRMIDPAIWNSEDFSELSEFAQLVWIGLFSQADDQGRGKAKPAYLKSILFPYSEDVKLVKKVDSALNEIAKNMSVVFYQIDNNEYYQLENWAKWQKVDKPQASKITPYSDKAKIIRKPFGEYSANSSRKISEQSSTNQQTLSPNKNKNKNEIEQEYKENENKQACVCDDLLNKFSFNELLQVCESESPVLIKRHREDPNGDYRLGLIYDEIAKFHTLDEVKALLKHANKTYVVQPKYNTLDLCWVLNNWQSVESASEITVQHQQSQQTKEKVSEMEARVWESK